MSEQMTFDAYRLSDPETSRMAAVDAALNAQNLRAVCLRVLMDDGPMTDFELADAVVAHGWHVAGQTSAGKRRGELRDLGLVEPLIDADGRTVKRPSPSGSMAIVWKVAS